MYMSMSSPQSHLQLSGTIHGKLSTVNGIELLIKWHLLDRHTLKPRTTAEVQLSGEITGIIDLHRMYFLGSDSKETYIL